MARGLLIDGGPFFYWFVQAEKFASLGRITALEIKIVVVPMEVLSFWFNICFQSLVYNISQNIKRTIIKDFGKVEGYDSGGE